MTLQELEEIKNNRHKSDSVKYQARTATKLLDSNSNLYEVVTYTQEVKELLGAFGLNESNDAQIVACAKYFATHNEDTVFVTDDICCKLIAKNIFGLNVASVDNNQGVYKGYKIIEGSTDDINLAMQNMDLLEWSVNEYLIIHNKDDNSYKEMRFDGDKFVALKLPPSKFIKAKNSLQRCTLDALLNPEITTVAVLGTYGSGKSFLCMQMALYNVKEKGNQGTILGIREIRGEGVEPGALPGDLHDKTDYFFAPLAQQLSGGEYELNDLKQKGIIDFQIPYYLKGTTYNSTIILSDEAEDLKESQIRLIVTRIGENSRVFFS